MMKSRIIYICLITILALTGCESESTGGVSDITNFAVIELEGDQDIFLEVGEEYIEPGATATENGSPTPVTTTSYGLFTGQPLNTDVIDIYNIEYSATNVDGYPASASRRVIVANTGNLVDDISGVYVSTVIRNGVSDSAYEDMTYIIIWKNEDGSFELSDGVGGYYMIGRAYGVAYAATGATIMVNGLNNYTFGPEFGVGAFGGVAKITEMTVDPDAKTINFKTDWDSEYLFDVYLTQVQY
ncbi:BT_2262 family domain-containing protein [Robertkochia solimangrovi]|uniref:BT_2262 family domain-containing protein n=1 Tax=Robertkochia solimangrovi TaxID=2213046 RepID=UPI00117C8BB2|nr:BT_2262 family domain-containing protein [Robertkochia solimangrovi]TRZ44240.1 hypothetical protein DMZ48_06925 [Robertkochia solimangrovi]